MNLQPVTMRPGQVLQCCTCGSMRPAPIWADLHGVAFKAYYCETCAPHDAVNATGVECPRTLALYKPGQPMPGVVHHFAYTGSVPCTGQLRCTLCGVIQS